ncbi:hypothetical protein BU15DRAFT_75992 [Melanogaster broomeanus]|nr:hypothetical protein BU15DRAFT_75992 [Melanogaster broomeanus]
MDGLDKLVDDVLIQVLQTLPVHAVLSLRKTSRRYYILSKLRCVWYTKFCTEVLACNLPPPGPPCPVSLLSSTDLESRTLRALYLENRWPRLSANTIVYKQRDERVDQVVFMPGGAEFLTVQNNKLVYWYIVSRPGLTQGLKKVAEWVAPEAVSCKVVKDCENPGVIAVGPREQSNGFAKVLTLSLKSPFATLCEYSLVPGVIAGISHHLLLLDTTGEPDGGGLELLDWHAQTTGTALLPCIPDLFGGFVDFVLFSDHILVVWEYCMSVFPVPEVPAQGQAIIEHNRVFIFHEPISRPVAFTTCATRGSPDPYTKRPRSSPIVPHSLTIAARAKSKASRVLLFVLVRLTDGDVGESMAFPYRLTWLATDVHGTLGESTAARISQTCTSLCLGSSGRGIYVVGRELRLCGLGLLFLPPYEMQLGPVFETGKATYLMDELCGDSGANGDKVDFDEGMGRFVVAKRDGGFEVVQLI